MKRVTGFGFGLLMMAVSALAQLGPTNPVAKVTLAWDVVPNAAGYRVYWGVAPRFYTNMVQVTGTNAVTIQPLVRGQTYYFAATAYNTAGLESDFSGEVSYTPAALPVAPTLRLVLEGGKVKLQVAGEAYQEYRMERSVDLVRWEEVARATARQGGTVVLEDAEPPRDWAFYRLKEQEA